MGKQLIVMALENEGQGLIESLGFEVLYCGVGKVNATYHLTKRLADTTRPVESVLNLGSAGSHVFSTGELVAADRFIQRDMDVSGLGFDIGQTPFEDIPAVLSFPRYFDHLLHGVCGSGDSFLQGESSVACDIIDMEAYALAKVCQNLGIPFVCTKYVTDGADKTAAQDWEKNLEYAAKAFAELLSNEQIAA